MNEVLREKKKYVLPHGSTLFTCARSKGLLARFVSDTQSTVQFIGEPLLTLGMKTRVSCLETPAGRWPSAVESTTNQILGNSCSSDNMLAPLHFTIDSIDFANH